MAADQNCNAFGMDEFTQTKLFYNFTEILDQCTHNFLQNVLIVLNSVID